MFGKESWLSFFFLTWNNAPQPDDPPRDNDLLKAIRTVRRQLEKARGDGETKLDIRILPNWLSAGAPHESVGSGGPGKIRADETSLVEPAYDSAFHWLNTPEATSAAVNPVNLFILDTLPAHIIKQRRITGAAAVSLADLTSNHPLRLLEQMITNGDFHFYPAADPQALPVLKDFSIPGFAVSDAAHPVPDRTLTEHGLFIAGILASVLTEQIKKRDPKINIHLIQILNDNCIGTMQTLTQGLTQALDIISQDPTVPAVINFSLDFSTPFQVATTSVAELAEDLAEAIRRIFAGGADAHEDEIAQDIAEEESELKSALDLSAEVGLAATSNANRYLVASAGNEGEAGPRYPANAQGIIGVGAVDRWTPAAAGQVVNATRPQYSNQAGANATPTNWVWAWGGDWNVAAGSNAPGNGILGVSLLSPDGYSWWAGTSFAAAVVSGALADIISRGMNVGKFYDICQRSNVVESSLTAPDFVLPLLQSLPSKTPAPATDDF